MIGAREPPEPLAPPLADEDGDAEREPGAPLDELERTVEQRDPAGDEPQRERPVDRAVDEVEAARALVPREWPQVADDAVLGELEVQGAAPEGELRPRHRLELGVGRPGGHHRPEGRGRHEREGEALLDGEAGPARELRRRPPALRHVQLLEVPDGERAQGGHGEEHQRGLDQRAAMTRSHRDHLPGQGAPDATAMVRRSGQGWGTLALPGDAPRRGRPPPQPRGAGRRRSGDKRA